jgi:signal peptide peptidase SppA
MRYLHVLSAFAGEPWAMQPEKLQAITAFLMFKAQGGHFAPDELQARISDGQARKTVAAPGGIAVLPVHGVISQRAGMMQEISGGTSTEALGAAFRSAIQDDTIKAVVFDVDSPGGGVYGVDELAADIRSARGVKPIIAQVNSVCASAAYYLASQADEVVMTPSGEAGSIGVYGVHEDVSEMLAREGVKPTLIRGEKGVHKAETVNFNPLADETREFLQARVNAAEDAFIKAVAAGRGVKTSDVVANFGKGRMFDAAETVKRGMADRVATMRETLERFGAQAPRYGAAADSRRAFAAGENPSLSQVEDVLRDAGFPKTLAAAFVSGGKGAFRRSESGVEASDTKVSEHLRQALEGLAAFQLPQL